MASNGYMQFAALATDYDGTLARDGSVDQATVAALERFRAAGRRLILVTGRQIPDLRQAFPDAGLFDVVAGENGGVLWLPASDEERPLAPPPDPALLSALRAAGVAPSDSGRTVIASNASAAAAIARILEETGAPYRMIFNRESLMLLPAGVDKATGFRAAAQVLGLAPADVAGIGDAENDEAFLAECGLFAVVANALAPLRERAGFIARSGWGAGVSELIDRLLREP
jgi:hydroxymethylpyrimidine pyrophosphatase-like HAD family hydrolase